MSTTAKAPIPLPENHIPGRRFDKCRYCKTNTQFSYYYENYQRDPDNADIMLLALFYKCTSCGNYLNSSDIPCDKPHEVKASPPSFWS